MSKVYFGFAVADSMFQPTCNVTRRPLTVEEVRSMVDNGVISCLNPSHQATIDAMRQRFGLDVEIPATPPKVSLGKGDSVIVMAVQGLPRLTDRREYTTEEVEGATFAFGLWTVTG